jgi:DNA-directed RNA polymerase subunit RPC12/RpoP
MASRCAGQDSRNLRAGLYRCPTCGVEAEIFSDETRIKCKECDSYIYRDKMTPCIEWCSNAKACLGEERWKEIKGEKGG